MSQRTGSPGDAPPRRYTEHELKMLRVCELLELGWSDLAIVREVRNISAPTVAKVRADTGYARTPEEIDEQYGLTEERKWVRQRVRELMEQGLSDAEVAAAMPDMTVRAARRFREKLRILRKRGGTKKQRILESGWLGTMSDVEVAAKLGVSVGYVRFVRTNEGIPAFDESVGPARDKP